MSVNKVILVGNVGQDPTIRKSSSDIKVASFSLATSETYTAKSGEKLTNTEWHNIVAWRGLSDVVEKYVKKGSQLYVEGKIKTRSWDDKEGAKRYATDIVADVIQILGRKPEGSNTNQEAQQHDRNTNSASTQSNSFKPEEDDLPF